MDNPEFYINMTYCFICC